MLDSLEIKNYRNLEHLVIERLGRVNLITGKNNTGKSSILEALAIYASKGHLGVFYDIVKNRGEINTLKNSELNLYNSNIQLLSDLFTNSIDGNKNENYITIAPVKKNGTHYYEESNDSISLKLTKYITETKQDSEGNILATRAIVKDDFYQPIDEVRIGLQVGHYTNENKWTLISLTSEIISPLIRLSNNLNYQFVTAFDKNKIENGLLFDEVIFTYKEQYIINALKLVENNVERIAFEGFNGNRVAVIKLSNIPGKFQINEMGDGINRILTIILALVNAENGYLLVDEIENGLHYSVQNKLWEIIFKLSKQLNVQVFATTHSLDCLNAFSEVLNQQEGDNEGYMIRLDNLDGKIQQVEFDAKELKFTTEQDIEIR